MKKISQEESEVYNHAIQEWFNNPELSTIDMDVFVKGAIFGAKWQKDHNNINSIEDITRNLSRVEVIDSNKGGRAYTNYSVRGVQLSFQDNGETLKVFVK